MSENQLDRDSHDIGSGSRSGSHLSSELNELTQYTDKSSETSEASHEFLANEMTGILHQLKDFVELPEDGKITNVLLKANAVMLSSAAVLAGSAADGPNYTLMATLGMGGLLSLGSAKLQAMLGRRGQL